MADDIVPVRVQPPANRSRGCRRRGVFLLRETAGRPTIQLENTHRLLVIGDRKREQRVHAQLRCVGGECGPPRCLGNAGQFGMSLRAVVEIGVQAGPLPQVYCSSSSCWATVSVAYTNSRIWGEA